MKHIFLVHLLLFSICLNPILLDAQSTPSPVLSYAFSRLNMSVNLQAQKPFSTPSQIAAASDVKDVIQTIQYTDGLGRKVETILKNITPSGKNIYNQNLYDAYGREVTKYLPTVYSSNAYMDQGALTSIGNSFNAGMYPGESDFFSKVDVENSPLNRVTKSYAQGSSWVGSSRGVSQQYITNTASDGVRIWLIGLTQGALPTSAAIYGTGQLYKTIKTDEQGRQLVTYSDKGGHTILTKQQLTGAIDAGTGSPHAGWICTYYIYDDYGNLRFVLTPKAVSQIDGTWVVSQAVADGLCYRLEYDVRNNVIIRKNPGKAEQWFVYDGRGRQVMAQDGNLRAQHKWEYFEFDSQDRPVAHGLITDPSNYNNLTFHLNGAAASISYPNLSSYTTEQLLETYYDDYTWASAAGMPTSLDQSNVSNTSYFYSPSNNTYPYPAAIVQTQMTIGMVTGSMAKAIGGTGTTYLYSVSFYDDKGRTIQSQNKNITGGIDKTTTQYSWSGKTLRNLEQQQYSVTGHSQTHVILTKFNYDNTGRLASVSKTPKSTIGTTTITGTEKTIVKYSYDELGRIEKESLGQLQDTAHPLETRIYEYNVRGWLLGINRAFTRDVSQASNTGCGECFVTPPDPKPSPGNFFGFDLGYDKQNNNLAGNGTYLAAQYTGNITGTVWKSANDDQVRKYDYTYDNAYRLTGAAFNQYNGGAFNKTAGIDYTVSNIGYDQNGNLASMNQMGLKTTTSSLIDQLTYNYVTNSNFLKYVADNANDANSSLGDFHYDAVSKTSSTVDYTYDVNGNVLSDQNKHLTYSYNYLNLPQSIAVTNKGTITYIYDALGEKLRKVVIDNTVTPARTVTYTYIGGMIYRNDTLQSIADEVGRIRIKASPNSFAYDYFLTDNQGSTRLVITDDTTLSSYIVEATSYYPFGLGMASINTEIGGILNNFYGYQGKQLQAREFSDGTGLEMYDFEARFYDQQLGVWHNQDPSSQYGSPYLAMGANWINGTDPNGEWFGIDDLIAAGMGFVVGYVSHGISTGHWGGSAIVAGVEGAASAWVAYNTMGLSMSQTSGLWTGSNLTHFGINTALTTAASYLPGPSFSIGDFHFGLSPAISMSGIGVNFNGGYSDGKFSIGGSYGVGYNTGTNDLTGQFFNDSKGSYSFYSASAGTEINGTYYGGTYGLNSSGGTTGQKIGYIGMQFGDFGLRIDEDALYSLSTDRWRTGGGTATYRINKNTSIAVGLAMITGKIGKMQPRSPNDRRDVTDASTEAPFPYRGGAFYGGIINNGTAHFIGGNSEGVLHGVQNFIHRATGTKYYFENQSNPAQFWSYFGNYNVNTLVY